jgi:uncharacterized protein (TIGR03790 family)
VTVLLLAVLWAGALPGQRPSPAHPVVVVENARSALSRSVAEYYARRRAIPKRNVCSIEVADAEEIERATFDQAVARPLAGCLRARGLAESTLYLVTTAGVPLRIAGSRGLDGDVASVDSELTLLYSRLHGGAHPVKGVVPNPFFNRIQHPLKHPDVPIYLVTRLAGYDFADIKGLVDRALTARNQGKFVIDMRSGSDEPGEDWLRDAAVKLPGDRLVLDQSGAVLYGQPDVIGFASWGSNDSNRRRRTPGFRWLPGAVLTEYVSTNARTFRRPPEGWNIGTWKDQKTWFAGSPQTIIADYIHEGVTGVTGHVAEPYLQFTPRPQILLPAYYSGRNLAESFYLSIPALSWQNIVIGDPLCRLGKPK